MLTYRCNARCAFCYTYSGPDRGGWMSAEQAVRLWRELDDHATEQGIVMQIHLAGGEPFLDWVQLVSVLRAARDAGLTRPAHVETNAAWATHDGLTRARLELLDALGVQRLIVSADVFHQEYVPFERVERCVKHARQVFGKGRLIVRWWDFFNDPIDTRHMSTEEKEAAFRAALAQHPDRMNGRAADEVAHLLPLHAPEAFAGAKCDDEVLRSRHVHIDPDGQVFPGTCAGIILGTANERSVGQVWNDLSANWPDHPVVSVVVAGGSYELARRAEEFGFRPQPDGYASKCHLCQHVRQFLFDHGHWPDHVGPAACYASTTS